MWVIPPFFGKGRKERKQLGPAAFAGAGPNCFLSLLALPKI